MNLNVLKYLLLTLDNFYSWFEYFLEVVTPLKNENFRFPDMNKTESLKVFLKCTVKTLVTMKISLNVLTNLKWFKKMKEEPLEIKTKSSIS